MTPADLSLDVIGAAVAAAAAGAAIAFGFIRARTDWVSGSRTREESERAEVREIIEIKDEMIAALKEQNEELATQLKRAARREEQWRRERDELRKRLEAVEDSFRTVVTATVSAGICAKAPGCVNYVAPGERRSSGEEREGITG